MADDDGMRAQAARHVDDTFRRQQTDFIHEQQRQEQRELALHKLGLQSWQRNREAAENRHAQRLRTIEEKRDRMADRITARHNSIGGRVAAMTKKGRERQAGELQRLDDRAEQLQARARRNFHALTERQFQGEMADRTRHARELKGLRQQHFDARKEHQEQHQNTRAAKIEQAVRLRTEVQLKQQLQQLARQQAQKQTPQQERTLSR